jgi:Rieske 2Fe-2S family protein
LTPAGQPVPNYPGGWKEGTTIPGEYYVDERHYLNDERFLKEHFWWMVGHEAQIPKPGDYFLYQFGIGDSVIIARDQTGKVNAFHNMCRHRGSRVCLHNEDLPTEAGPGGKRPDAAFSIRQLGSEGNTAVFRCPYHAWSYDLTGALVSTPPNGNPPGFDPSQHGLHLAPVRTVEGFIYITFAQNPPEFSTFTGQLEDLCKECSTANLKLAARRSVPTKANWKLVIENFVECYHCQPSHSNSYCTAYWHGDETLSAAQVAAIEQATLRHGHEAGDWQAAMKVREAVRDYRLGNPTGGAMAAGANRSASASRQRHQHWRPGFVTASVDGKPVAPLLPGLKERTHNNAGGMNYRKGVGTGMSLAGVMVLEDYAFSYRFTPRGVRSTDVEMLFFVHPDAKEGKDYNVDHVIGLWYNTLREDRWVAENNHTGLLSSRYAMNGGQPYMLTEGGPAGFVRWYMRDVVPTGMDRQTEAR